MQLGGTDRRYFPKDELTVVWQTIIVETECNYCVPAHTGIAKIMGVDDAITDALRQGTKLPITKLQVLQITIPRLNRKARRFNNAGFSC